MSAKAIYRALLRFYPAAFREEYGGQMLLSFDEQLRESSHASVWARVVRDVFTIAPKEHAHVMFQDLRYALRTMAANPSFTAVAILSLALGIGANTAIFSLWNGVLHATLPVVRDPEQLVMLTNPDKDGMWRGRSIAREDGPREYLTFSEFEDLRDHADAFSSVMASQTSLRTWGVRVESGEKEQARGRLVSGGFFDTLGVTPILGRAFTPAADQVGGAPEVVISHSYWQRRFGGNPDVLGKRLTVQKAELTIIGIAPPGFIGETGGQQPDLWVPIGMQATTMPGEDRLHDAPPQKVMWLHVFARLKPGVTLAQAEAQTNSIFKVGLESFYGNVSAERRADFLDQYIKIRPASQGASAARHTFSTSLTALMAGVGVLLLIACANLANLLLARGASRKSEIALRLSLGASRGRLIRQLVTESLALAALGGAGGMALAYFLHGALVEMLARSFHDFKMGFTLDASVLAFAMAATFSAALLFGVLPAWQATRVHTGESLKEQSRSATGSQGRMRWGRILVSVQLGLSLPLLVGAGLLVRTLYNLQTVDLGYSSEHLLLVRVNTVELGYDEERNGRLFSELLGEIRQIPGVRAASFSALGIFSGGDSNLGVVAEGHAATGDNDRGANFDRVGPKYFSTLGVPIVLGRELLESDVATGTRYCVINEALAQRFFNKRNPVGMHLTSITDKGRIVHEIIGVAKNARTHGLREDVEPRYFVFAGQPPFEMTSPFYLIRTVADPGSVLSAARQAIQRVDSSVPILSAESLRERMTPLLAQDRAVAQLAMAFGGVAILLAAIGLYGVLSYGVVRRRSEIAIRIALGAQASRVVGMILRETMALIIAGLALGAGLAYVATRLITTQLFGVAPEDPLTLGVAIALLVLVALFAAYLPAHRASRLDPMAALRRE